MPLPDWDAGGPKSDWDEGGVPTDDSLLWLLMLLAVMGTIVVFVLLKKFGG
jgi:hypothetical protein